MSSSDDIVGASPVTVGAVAPAMGNRRRTERRELLVLLLRSPAFMIGLVVILFWTVCGIFGDRITPYRHDEIVIEGGNLIVAHPSFPAGNMRELIDYAKRNPGKISYATSGIGGAQHLDAESIARLAGIEWTHVPFQGFGPMIPAMIIAGCRAANCRRDRPSRARPPRSARPNLARLRTLGCAGRVCRRNGREPNLAPCT